MAKLARLPGIGRSEAEADVPRVPRLRTRYYAFLSYSHRDKELADWLHRELERFRVPSALAGKLTANGVVPRRLVPVFRDQQDLSAGDDLAEEIKAALAASQFLIVLCSPEAAKSRWTNQEIESFKRTRPEGCVLAAVASGEPFASDLPGHEEEECFPPALRYKYDRRGRQTTKRAEPLAADFREEENGRRLAFLKLVAGMLGVGLDELVQRETTRRHRRMAWLAAASLAGMAVTSTLAVTALRARDSAREQRREAEGLVEFMVGDLREKLEPIGRLDALDGVGSRVLSYYSRQDTSDLSDDALLQRSRALNLMAEVTYNRGNLDQAERLYQQAMASSGEAVRRSPRDPKRLFEHAQNVFYVGEVARYAGRPADAEAAYREYKRLADEMSGLEPDNLKYRMEVLYADEDLGISLYDEHRFTEAAEKFGGLLASLKQLSSIYPSNVTYQKQLAEALGWAADAQRALGNIDSAIGTRRRQVALLAALSGAGADSNVRARLIYAHEGLGLALADHSQSNASVEELHAAVDGAESLIALEPRNADWKRAAANARFDLAEVLLSVGGRANDAAQQTAAGCALWRSLPPTFATSGRTRLESACAMLQSRLTLARGDTRQAGIWAEQAVRSARGIHSQNPVSDRYWMAATYRQLGDVRNRAGDRPGATLAWSSALAALPSNVAEPPLEMNERLRLLRRLGRKDEAKPLAQRLATLGYNSID